MLIDHLQAVDAAVDLLTELPEYAPEQLLTILKPHMLTMAQAACHAATSAGTLHLKHAAAWVRAFAAYASAVPQHVLQPSELGGSLRDALLQVTSKTSVPELVPATNGLGSFAI